MNPVIYTVPESRFLEMTGAEWVALVGASAVITGAVALVYSDLTVAWAASLALSVFVAGHMCLTVARHIAFPDLIVFAGCLQWLIGPWLSDIYPPTLPAFKMAIPLDVYYRYAIPATVALWLGLQIPVSRKLSRTWALATLPPLSIRMRRTLDVFIVIGILADTFGPTAVPFQFAFLAYLVGLIRLYAAIGWMVTRTPGWVARVVLVGGQFVVVQSASGLFYSIVHWAGYFALLVALMRGWRWRFAAAIVVGMLSIGVLQQVKPTFRQSLATRDVSDPVGSFVDLLSLVKDRLAGADTLNTLPTGDTVIRFNQGWIIGRIIAQVPAVEPYAHGQTLIDAAQFSILPRFLFPSKRMGASAELFTQYTGVQLSSGTSMGLGLIGEMYANFGSTGGIVATFAYGLAIGWIFGLFAERALTNPIWWAAAALVLVPSVEPGMNIEDITNHVVKAGVLLLLAIHFVPAFGAMLARAPAPDLFAGGAGTAERVG